MTPAVLLRLLRSCAAACLVAVLASPASVDAASPGWLDPGFGSSGVVVVPVGAGHRAGCGFLLGVRVAGTGRIYVNATRCGMTSNDAFDEVTAFTPAGRSDGAFHSGRPLTLEGRDRVNGDGIADVFAATDGGLLTWSRYAEGPCDRAQRYSSSGVRWTTFGPSCLPEPESYVGAAATRLPGGSLRWCLVNTGAPPVGGGLSGLTPSGALDTGVGPKGFRSLAFDRCVAFTSDAAGRLYWISRHWLGDGRAAVEVHRMTQAGNLDTAWGEGGRATIELAQGHLKPVMAVAAADGSLLIGVGVSSFAVNSGWDAGVARLRSDGTVDAAFGTDGVRVYDPPHTNGSQFLALTVDSAGRPIVSLDVPTGRPYPGPSTTGYLMRGRASDGAPDPSFGTGGWVRLSRPIARLAMAGPSRIVGLTPVRDSLVLSARSN